MQEFKVGDIIYFPKCRHENITVTCPVCFGKRLVTLILGNEEAVELPCDYCGKGWDGPRGVVEEYELVIGAELFLITSKEITEDASGGRHVRYYSDHSTVINDELACATREEALDRAKEMKAELDEERRTRVEHIKKDVKKSFSWNAGYHLREAKRCRQQAEYHDERAKLCRAKGKEA